MAKPHKYILVLVASILWLGSCAEFNYKPIASPDYIMANKKLVVEYEDKVARLQKQWLVLKKLGVTTKESADELSDMYDSAYMYYLAAQLSLVDYDLERYDALINMALAQLEIMEAKHRGLLQGSLDKPLSRENSLKEGI